MRQLANKEKELLEKLGAKATINSGATFGDADGKILLKKPIGFYQYEKLAIEVKATEKKSYSIKLDTFKKLAKEAQQINAMPILGLDISGKQFIILQLNDFQDLLEWMQNG